MRDKSKNRGNPKECEESKESKESRMDGFQRFSLLDSPRIQGQELRFLNSLDSLNSFNTGVAARRTRLYNHGGLCHARIPLNRYARLWTSRATNCRSCTRSASP